MHKTLFTKGSSGFFLCLISLTLLLSFPGCKRAGGEDNFILITLDTQRADYISAYNPVNASTPNIDSLAGVGTRYENCFSLIPITLPSHASIFFSEPPHIIKNYNNGQIITSRKKRPPFTSIFQKNGFRTAAFVSLGVLTSQFGLAEGFDVYEDDFPENRWYLNAGEVNRNVFDWLDQNTDQNFFMWVHYSDPHDPYNPPGMPKEFTIYLNDEPVKEINLGKYEKNEIELDLKSGENTIRFGIINDSLEDQEGFLGRMDVLDFSSLPEEEDIEIDFYWGWFIQRERSAFFFKNNAMIDITNLAEPRRIKLIFRGKPWYPVERIRELYRQEVEYMDGEVGKLLNKLKELHLFEKTHIVVVGDHGEGLGEYHNQFGDPHVGHIHFLQNVYMQVPLIIYNPHSPKEKIEKEYVTLLDIAPTIMDLMNFKNIPAYQGRNLLRLKKRAPHTILEETYRPEAVKEKFAILQHPWHLITTPEDRKYELYNLDKDLNEKEDIFAKNAQLREVSDLKRKLDEFAREVLNSKVEIKIDKQTEEMLKSLGYIK